MNHILVVDDEPNMRIGLEDNLNFEGYKVTTAEDGKKALELCQKHDYDIILLDVMMPEVSGFDVCKKIRERGDQTPIIFLTAKGEEIDKVLGLELGADDYITKPFSIREILARIKAILRRSGVSGETSDSDPGQISIGNLTVDFHSYQSIDQSDNEVKMTHKEFEILHYLYSHKNTAISRSELLEKVWGYDESPTTRTVDNFILKLRNKIEDNPNDPKIIITVHGMGYKFVI